MTLEALAVVRDGAYRKAFTSLKSEGAMEVGEGWGGDGVSEVPSVITPHFLSCYFHFLSQHTT